MSKADTPDRGRSLRWSACPPGRGRSRSDDASDELADRRNRMLSTILIVVVVLMLLGALPRWPYSSGWGYYPSGGVGLLLLILVILAITGRL
jgi:hypothetical protein